MAQCPRCGRDNFQYELRSAGTRSKTNYYRTGVKHSWVVPAGQRRYQSQRKQRAVGICSNCGYTEEKHEKGCLFYFLCFAFFPVTLSVWFYRAKTIRLDKKWRALIIAAFWILFCVIMEATQA